MFGIFFQIFFAILIATTTAFSYNPDPERAASVSKRWNLVQSIPINERTPETLNPICGALNRPPPICSGNPGRPRDEESNHCDSYCCHQGYLTGFCSGGGVQGCSCTNNGRDALCGPDGSFAGIRCPDRSACKRKCCRQQFPNYSGGGRCAGLVGLKCKC